MTLAALHETDPTNADLRSSPARRRAAERQRRRWARMRRGEIVAPVPVTAPVLDVLVELRWLAEHDAGDRVAIGDAIGRLLADLAKHQK